MPNDVQNLIAQRLDVSVRRSDEATVKALLDAAADGACIHDLDGAIVELNQCFADMVGYGRDEMRALNIADIVVGVSAEVIHAALRQTAESGRRRVADLRLRRNDGLT